MSHWLALLSAWPSLAAGHARGSGIHVEHGKIHHTVYVEGELNSNVHVEDVGAYHGHRDGIMRGETRGKTAAGKSRGLIEVEVTSTAGLFRRSSPQVADTGFAVTPNGDLEPLGSGAFTNVANKSSFLDVRSKAHSQLLDSEAFTNGANATKVVQSDPSPALDGKRATASCPDKTWVQKCESVPPNAEDGIEVDLKGKSCSVISNGGAIRAKATCAATQTFAVASAKMYVDNKVVTASCSVISNGGAIRAKATCAATQTFAVASAKMYVDNKVVTASCSSGTPLSCTCSTHWRAKIVCSAVTVFAPTGSACTKKIPRTSYGRRRNTEFGGGAKIFAICASPTTTTTMAAKKETKAEEEEEEDKSTQSLADQRTPAVAVIALAVMIFMRTLT